MEVKTQLSANSRMTMMTMLLSGMGAGMTYRRLAGPEVGVRELLLVRGRR